MVALKIRVLLLSSKELSPYRISNNLQIVLVENVPINASYSIQERRFFIGIMRIVKKEMIWSFDIITTTANHVKLILKAVFEFVIVKMN